MHPSARSELYVMKRSGHLNARSSPPHRNKHLTARSSPQHFTPSYEVDRMSHGATTDTATKIQMQRNTNRNQSSTSRQHQPSTETSTAGEREPAQPSRSVASHCSRKACRSKVKLRSMLLRTGQKQWILGCSVRGHQSRNTAHRNSTCSEQATAAAIKGPTPVADKNLVA